MIKSLAALVLLLLLLGGCGYKPATHYTQEVLTDAIFADVTVSRTDPRGAGVMADTLREAVVAKFKGRLVSRQEATTELEIIRAHHEISTLQRDDQGFVVLYRSTVTITTRVNSPILRNQNLHTSGTYDFAVSPDSVLSEGVRTEASRQAASRALDELVARLILLGR